MPTAIESPNLYKKSVISENLSKITELYLDHVTGEQISRTEAVQREFISLNEMEADDENDKESKPYKKPQRPCVLCNRMRSQLRRHISSQTYSSQ